MKKGRSGVKARLLRMNLIASDDLESDKQRKTELYEVH